MVKHKKPESSESKESEMASLEIDEELSLDGDDVISASEDEEDSDAERKHTKLLEAISSLGGKKRRKLKERSEASLQVSEFSVNAEGAGEKLELSDLLGSIEKTPGAPNKTKKQLRNLQSHQETLELPLSRQQSEKIQRGVAFERSTKEVSRWESVIKQNQKAEQLVFPLKQEPAGPKRIEQVVAGWKAQTPLEQQIFSLLHSNKQPIHDPLLTPVEEASISAMSLEEAKIRRAELQKARALQSYYESKARRERKIKSKKYHKVQKKAKKKEFLKQFDEMMKSNPDAALEELRKMELSRMEERMSLKHQNSGKWAKTKAIMAKYDDSARRAMQEQLQLNKELTQKLSVPSDDDEKGHEDEGALPDFVNDAEPVGDSVNPWMKGKLTSEVPEAGGQENTGDSSTAAGQEPQISPDQEEEEEEENEEEELLRQFERTRKLREDEDDLVWVSPPEEETPAVGQESTEEMVKERVEGVSDEDEEEDEVVSEFNSIFNKLMKCEHESTVQSQTKQIRDKALVVEEQEEELLDEGLVRVRTMEDMEALGQDEAVKSSQSAPGLTAQTSSENAVAEPASKKKKDEIDPNQVLTREIKVIKVPLVPTMIEQDEEGEEEEEQGSAQQIAIIKEAFAGDDVVSDFLKDKRKQEEAGKPKVVDMTLPGWGEWGGVGIQPSLRKRSRFQLKPPPAPVRKDQKLPAVILSEKRNSSMALHQVSQLPFPFEDSAQFESCITYPVGQTWNTQNTVKKLTAPKVVTRLGTIIDPIRKEDFMTTQKNAEATQKKGGIVFQEREKTARKRGTRKRTRL